MAGDRRTLTALGIRAGEAPLVGWVAALFFAIQASHGVGLNAADALFFLRFGVEHLPVMILASGIAVMLGILGYAAGLSWRGARSWLWPVPIAGAAVVILERVGIAAGVPGIYPVVWLAAQVVMMVTFTLMWNAAGEVCTTRQAKRLFPLFASAGIAGGIVGNALTGPAAALAGAENLLLLQAGLLVAGGLLTRGASRRFFREDADEAPASPIADMTEGLRVTWRTPLLRLVAAVTLSLSILFFLVVFPFSETVAGSFDTESGVAGYLGAFSSIATAATFLVSLLLARALFTRLGVVVTLLVVPVVYASGFALWLGALTLVTASIVRGAQWIAVNALGGTAMSSLFNVLRGRRRAQVMAFVTAVPAQLGTVLSGAILLVAGDLPPRARFAISLALAVGSGLLVLRMRRAYRLALVDAVESGLVDVFTAPTTGIQKPSLEADALHALTSALSDDRPGRRRVAAAMLGRLGPNRPVPALRERLTDPDPGVRIAALEALGTAAACESLLMDRDASVRLRALELGAADGLVDDASVVALLDDPDPRVRAAVAVAVGGDDGKRVVGELVLDDDAGAVVAGLGAVARGADPGAIDLTALASHPDRAVRQGVTGALDGSPAGLATLRRLLDDVSPGVRIAAGRTLAEGDAGRGVLLDVLGEGSVRASEAALAALVDAGAHPQLRPWVEGEMGRAATLGRWAASLGDDGPAARRLLARVLRSRRDRLGRWAIRALEAESPALAAVRRGAWSDDPETRAQALEALESIADRPLAHRLIALIETGEEGGETTRDAYREMAKDFDPWIRALALRAFSDELLDDLAGVVGTAAGDASPLVREASPVAVPPARAGDADGVLARVIALSEVPLFSGLDPEELQFVATAADLVRHQAGAAVFHEGEHGDAMLVITEGSVEVRTGDSVVAVRRPGEFVGELSILRGAERMADVVAGPDGVSGLTVGAGVLQGLLEERPESALSMLATIAERIAELVPHEVGVTVKLPQGRPGGEYGSV